MHVQGVGRVYSWRLLVVDARKKEQAFKFDVACRQCFAHVRLQIVDHEPCKMVRFMADKLHFQTAKRFNVFKIFVYQSYWARQLTVCAKLLVVSC